MTTEQRKKLYAQVYEYIGNNIENDNFVCHIINIMEGEDLFSSKRIIRQLPELLIFKYKRRYGQAWLSSPDISYTNKQINEFKLTVLAFCMAMCDNP